MSARGARLLQSTLLAALLCAVTFAGAGAESVLTLTPRPGAKLRVATTVGWLTGNMK